MKYLIIALSLALVSCAPGAHAPTAQPGEKGEGIRIVDGSGKELLVNTKEAAAFCFVEPTPELKARLSAEQWDVLVNAATEPPFRNPYWNNHEPGIYVDAIDGVPLFASTTKFDSGTGWPSFFDPIDPERLLLVEDKAFGMVRIEVRAKASGGHLGHVFNDGPAPTGLRYCINSASLRFIHRDKLVAEGYGGLAQLFS
jgi:methionine-R-sulfoxide reductase